MTSIATLAVVVTDANSLKGTTLTTILNDPSPELVTLLEDANGVSLDLDPARLANLNDAYTKAGADPDSLVPFLAASRLAVSINAITPVDLRNFVSDSEVDLAGVHVDVAQFLQDLSSIEAEPELGLIESNSRMIVVQMGADEEVGTLAQAIKNNVPLLPAYLQTRKLDPDMKSIAARSHENIRERLNTVLAYMTEFNFDNANVNDMLDSGQGNSPESSALLAEYVNGINDAGLYDLLLSKPSYVTEVEGVDQNGELDGSFVISDAGVDMAEFDIQAFRAMLNRAFLAWAVDHQISSSDLAMLYQRIVDRLNTLVLNDDGTIIDEAFIVRETIDADDEGYELAEPELFEDAPASADIDAILDLAYSALDEFGAVLYNAIYNRDTWNLMLPKADDISENGQAVFDTFLQALQGVVLKTEDATSVRVNTYVVHVTL